MSRILPTCRGQNHCNHVPLQRSTRKGKEGRDRKDRNDRGSILVPFFLHPIDRHHSVRDTILRTLSSVDYLISKGATHYEHIAAAARIET